ncbi:MAG: hypothetical protein JXR34_01510 [Bacteroidales bacterium]|nr:hypothetical protein [Bacteroidales bacterium]
MSVLKHIPSESFFDREKVSKFYVNKNRPILIGINLRNPANIGGLIRLGGNIGAQKVILINDNQKCNLKKVKQASANAYEIIETFFATTQDWEKLVPENYEIMAIETATSATNIYATKLPVNLALMVGSEVSGIPDSILTKCSRAIFIPTFGHTLSLNVVQAAAIASYEWLRQQSI